METRKKDIEETASTVPLAFNGYVLPLETACSALPDRNVPTSLSVKDVCPTLPRCSSTFHSSTANACGQKNTECDVNKAIPLMIGVFFYIVSFAFVDKFCSGKCSGDNGCNLEEEYASIAKQVDLMRAFSKILPENTYEQIFRGAVTKFIAVPASDEHHQRKRAGI